MPVEISPVVKVNGSDLPATARTALISVEVDRGFNLVGRATLRFVEPSYHLVAEPMFALATQVKISDPGGTELLSGEVTGISVDASPDLFSGPSVTETTVTVDDPSYKLGRTTKVTALLNQSYSDIISTMTGEAGLSADVDSAASSAIAYQLQTGTNLAYLDWICSRTGLSWWVDGTSLKVKKPASASPVATLTLGQDLMRVSSRASGRHPTKVTVTGWDDAQQQAVQHVASASVSAEADLVSAYPGRAATAATALTVTGAAPLTTAEAQKLSEARLAESASAAVTTRGTTLANASIAPGVTIKVADAGRASGSYVVSRVRHTYDSTGFYTHFTAGSIRPAGLVDLLGTPQPSAGGLHDNVLIGKVSNVDDPDKLGRVKVKFPSIGDTIESEWARIVTVGGGAKRGVVFQPEVDDEVLVAFEQGDTRRPLVLGGLFSSQRALPNEDNIAGSKDVAYRRITSRLGHVVEMADGTSDDTKHVMLKTASGEKIRVGADKIEIVNADKPVSITNGKAKIEFAANGDISIEGVNVTIKASGSYKVEGSGGVELKSDAAAKLQGLSFEIKGSASGTIDGGGSLAAKGGTVAIN